MARKQVGAAPSDPGHVVPKSYVDLRATARVIVSTGSEVRPDATFVIWMGGTVKPVNMIDGDLWFSSSVIATPGVPPVVTTTSLNSLVSGVAFTQTLGATGDNPKTWTVSAGTLPAGLTLASSTGVLSGTPSASGSYSFTVQATNSTGSDTQAYTGTVGSSVVIPVITTSSIASMTQNSVYSQTLTATGTTPITWGISAGALPTGIGINSSTGVLSGTPTGTGAYDFTVQATNSAGSGTQQYTGTVSAPSSAVTVSFADYGINSVLTSHSDATNGSWLGHMYYTLPGTDTTGMTITGVKVYVPAGSPAIGYSGGRVSVIRGLAGVVPGISNENLDAGNILSLPTLAAGWNTVTYPTPIQLYPNAGIAVGYELDGRYFYGFAVNNPLPVPNGDGYNFGIYRPGDEGAKGYNRAFYDGSGSNASNYGIEPIFSVPSLAQPAGPWVRRSPFRAPGILGSTAQTVNFKPATAGNKLMLCVAASALIATPSGWTLVEDAVGGTGLYVFTKVATSGESSVSISTSQSNYTVLGVVYEFVSTAVIGPSSSIDVSGYGGSQLNAGLTGLTGTNQIFALRSVPSAQTGGFVGVAWDQGLAVDTQMASYPDSNPVNLSGSLGFTVAVDPNITATTWQKGGATKTHISIQEYQAVTVAVKTS